MLRSGLIPLAPRRLRHSLTMFKRFDYVMTQKPEIAGLGRGVLDCHLTMEGLASRKVWQSENRNPLRALCVAAVLIVVAVTFPQVRLCFAAHGKLPSVLTMHFSQEKRVVTLGEYFRPESMEVCNLGYNLITCYSKQSDFLLPGWTCRSLLPKDACVSCAQAGVATIFGTSATKRFEHAGAPLAQNWGSGHSQRFNQNNKLDGTECSRTIS